MDQSEEGQKLEMWIGARDLKNTDIIGKSDPRCKVSIRKWNENWQVLGITETIKEDVNPNWKKVFKFDYHFCQHQILAFEIVDVDDRPGDQDDSLGKAYISVGDLITQKSNKITVKLFDRSNSPCGELIIHLSKEIPDHQFISWQWFGKSLADKDTFTSSDPMIVFSRKSKTGDWEEVYKSEVVDNDVDPQWKPFEIGFRQLVSKFGIFKISVYDIDDDDQQDLIGESVISLDDIVNGGKTEFNITDSEDNSISGTICVRDVKVRQQESLIDFMFSGLQINLFVAIDFTYSNGNQKQADSLHYISEDPSVQNLYESALESIGSILISYDTDKLVPLYGFGGVPKFKDYSKPYMDECFPLNGNPNDPTVKGIDGLLNTYKQSLDFIELSGPTYLKKVLTSAKEKALALEPKGVYSILLVLTDGQIEDMNDVIPIMLDCLLVPLSVIIIGIGDENFTYMKILDDNAQLSKDLKPGQTFRDICQFVSYKEIENNPIALCKRVLKELPTQIVSYMKIKGIKPKKSI